MVKCLDNLTECSRTEGLEKLVAKTQLLVFFPLVSTIFVVLADTSPYADVEHLLPAVELLFLVLGQKQTKSLDNFLPRPAGYGTFQTFLIS